MVDRSQLENSRLEITHPEVAHKLTNCKTVSKVEIDLAIDVVKYK